MKMNNSFYLCGFMRVGKTTILNNIKEQTKYSCIDLDESIENKFGQIENIFENLLKSHKTIYLSLNFERLWERIKNSDRPLISNGREVLESRYKNRIKRYEMMEYKISNENVKDTTSKVLEIMETQNA